MTDLDAALLLAQLPKVELKREKREHLVKRYEVELKSRIPEIGLVERRGQSSHHLFTIQVVDPTLGTPGCLRDTLLTNLKTRGIGTAVNYRAIHTLSYLIEILKIPLGAIPNAEIIGNTTVSLPLYPTLTEADQQYVIDEVVKNWQPL